jgi:hypothetical protein
MTGQERSAIIETWQEQKLLFIDKTTVYRKIQAHKMGKPVKPFHAMGRTAMFSDGQVDSIATSMNDKPGKQWDTKDLRETM